MIEILLLLAGLAAGSIVTWIICKLLFEKNFVSKQALDDAEKQLNSTALEKGKMEERMLLLSGSERKANELLQQATNQLETANKALSRLEAEKSSLLDKLETQKQDLEQIGQKFEKEFKLLAADILEEKTKSFNTIQENSLKTILDPLKNNIKEFKEEFENKLNNEAKEKGSLSQQIKQMMELNQNLSAQADNLTKALSNNVKQQGDWGEEILESILQYTGLQKDMQYFVQESSINEDGETIRPDVIVKYPDGRSLVIDSKVSLLHYTRFCAAQSQEEQELHRNQLLESFKKHIKGLDSRNYQSVTDALDLIMMFVPNEAAYITAMQADTSLWQNAYSRRVVVISPTNLVPAMKLVADMWQRDAINQNAIDIAEKAGKLYDKLVLFIDNFEKIGGQLDKAHEAWHAAQKQLWKGKGNLVSQAEQMKSLQAKATKQLPAELVEQALLEEGIDDGPEEN